MTKTKMYHNQRKYRFLVSLFSKLVFAIRFFLESTLSFRLVADFALFLVFFFGYWPPPFDSLSRLLFVFLRCPVNNLSCWRILCLLKGVLSVRKHFYPRNILYMAVWTSGCTMYFIVVFYTGSLTNRDIWITNGANLLSSTMPTGKFTYQ